MYGELIEDFNGQKVIEFSDAKSWKGPEATYRLREEYEDKVSLADRLNVLVEQPGVERLAGLILGSWHGSCEGDNSAQAVEWLVQVAPKLPGLRALFFGEMTVEECEVSWINQSDASPLLRAFPKMESFRVRGGNGLSFSRVRHEALREIAIETGGLPRSTLRELFLCDFPALEHLELLLGEPNYGFDGGVEDLQPVLSGQLYPRLRFLGLMNSEIANDIAAVVVNSPIVERIEVLDLSMGNLDDEGVRSLLNLAGRTNLTRVNISHHYAREESVEALRQALSCEVIAEDRQDSEDEWRPIVHAE